MIEEKMRNWITEYALSEFMYEKADVPIPPYIEKREGYCEKCMHELLKKCFKDHREWFTEKTKYARAKHHQDVKDYIADNIEKENCIVRLDYVDNGDYECNVEEKLICIKHLIEEISN